MTPSDEKRVLEILEHAFSLPTHARAEYVQQTCEGNQPLEKEVLACLEAESKTEWLPPHTNGFPNPLPEKIGAYFIERCLGEGGMGRVFLATRKDKTFQHRVAIKVLRHGIQSKAMVRRFLAERQILAQLNHPQIAMFFDGGSTLNGAPYLVMEFIDGIPITEYCQRHNLNLAQRLRLFLKVCDALAHAHQSLVIHRDLKPSNVLVTADGDPKLLDFGIAKPLGKNLEAYQGEATTGVGMMTPFYASPEQLRGEMLTPGVDVYGLGLLLYELIAQQPPFNLEQASLATIVQTICEAQVPKPSGVVLEKRNLSRGAATDLSQSAVLSKKWFLALRNDLDAVVLKALRKDPSARYRSALELGEEIRRFLAKKPVRAKAGNRWYRLKKSFARHRLSWLTAGFVTVSFFGFTTYIFMQRNQLQTERTLVLAQVEKANEMRDFLVALFSIPQASTQQAEPESVEDLLNRGLEKVETLGYAPEAKAQLLQTLSGIYRGMGWYDTANQVMDKSLEMLVALYEPSDERVLSGLKEKADILLRQGRFEEAKSELEIALPHLGAWSQQSLIASHIYLTYGDVLKALGQLQQAIDYCRKAIEIQRNYHDSDHPELALSLAQLGALQDETGDYQASMKHLEKAYAIAQNNAGKRPKLEIDVLKSLSLAYQRQHLTDKAERAYKQVLEWQQTALGKNHPEVAVTMHNLGTLYNESGQLERAKALFLNVLNIHKQAGTSDSPFVSAVLYNLSSVHYSLGFYEQAEQALVQVIALDKKFLGQEHPQLAFAYGFLGHVLARRESYERAEQHFQNGMTILANSLGENHPEFATILANYGDALVKKGDYEKAEPILKKALVIVEENFGQGKPAVGFAKDKLGTLYFKMKAFDQAIPLFEEALAIELAQGKVDPFLKASLEKRLAACFIGKAQFLRAEALLNRAHRFCKTLEGQARYQFETPVLQTKVTLYEQWGKLERIPELKTAINQLKLTVN